MTLAPPILPSTIDSRLREYIRNMSVEVNKAHEMIRDLKAHPLMNLDQSTLELLSQPSPFISPSQVFDPQQIFGLGQLSQGQYTYAPIVSILPNLGDPLSQNGQIV